MEVVQDEMGRHAVLCYSVFDRDDNPVLPARDELTAGVADRWKRSTGRLGTYQVQTFSTVLTASRSQPLASPAGAERAVRYARWALPLVLDVRPAAWRQIELASRGLTVPARRWTRSAGGWIRR